MNEIYFTDEERLQLIGLAKEIVRLDPESIEPYGFRKVKDYIIKETGKHGLKRDIFGFNPVITSLETCLVLRREINLSADAMVSCMLAPVINGEEQFEEIEREFGKDVRNIVEGMQRVKELYSKTPIVETENFRNLLVSFAEDIRVILIMTAERLSTMRRIRDVEDKEAQKQVAREAEYLYAPIAHKLGLYKIKSELEDLAVKYLEHDAYYMIREKLNATKRARDAYIKDFIEPIDKRLTEAGLKFHIKGRTKSIHSIWQKMQKQHCAFEGVYDLFAIRIILDCPEDKEKLQCWQVYSIITDMYQPNPKRLRDWLSVPKSNGYESLHITVLGPQNKWVEVQIRTERMDTIAEYGLAAHWRYKGVKSGESGIDEWIGEIRSILETGDNIQLIDQLQFDLKDEEVYVFTPKGDLYKLTGGATVLDFAYRIHSNIGNHCVGAKINGHNYPMRHKLKSGDQVEILTSNSQSPNPDWLNYVASARAKSKIRQALHEKSIKEGQFAREEFERKLKNRKLPWEEATINHLAKKTGYKELSEFFKAMAAGKLEAGEAAEQYEELYDFEHGNAERSQTISAGNYNYNKPENDTSTYSDDVLIIDRNLKGIDFSLAKCCHPIYGDEVFGFVTSGGGIKIHRTNCPNARMLRERFGYRIVKAQWAGKGGKQYIITLQVVGNDDIGIVNNMTSIIDKETNVFLRSIRIDSNDGLFSGILTVSVNDTYAVDGLIKKLRTVHGVKSITRI